MRLKITSILNSNRITPEFLHPALHTSAFLLTTHASYNSTKCLPPSVCARITWDEPTLAELRRFSVEIIQLCNRNQVPHRLNLARGNRENRIPHKILHLAILKSAFDMRVEKIPLCSSTRFRTKGHIRSFGQHVRTRLCKSRVGMWLFFCFKLSHQIVPPWPLF
jgi:hypothetical protein